jgi:hypothetical protein
MKPMHPRKRMLKIIRDIQDQINTIRWWNENRTDAAPFDLGGELVALDAAKRALAVWDSGDRKAFDEEYRRLIATMEQAFNK